VETEVAGTKTEQSFFTLFSKNSRKDEASSGNDMVDGRDCGKSRDSNEFRADQSLRGCLLLREMRDR
jgi:hypothetical protein